ncbi:odorant receptor 49a-like [Tribolium madens]|uniref:odorant receptor 49a-like n=1 Tax=Tribolium madens TaxID=41895 RepID=UPI001CF75B01|nr:odorant receptor 49a-like [Tribolium madens]
MEEVLQQSKKEMHLLHLWPKGQAKYFRFRYVITLILVSPFSIGTLTHFINVFKEDLDVDVSGDISVIAVVTGLHFMLITFVWGHKNIAHLWENLGPHNNFGTPDNFQKRCKQLNFYSRLYSYYCYLGLIVYIIMKNRGGIECRRLNVEKNLTEICGLVTTFWAPFDIDFFPFRQILFVDQVFATYFIVKGGAAISFTTLEVGEYIILKLKHLKRLLKEVFDDSREEVQRKRLLHCIKYHQYIISIQELYDGRYKHCNGCYILMVGIIIASLSNEIMKKHNIEALLHLAGWVFSFYICCFSGQSLLSESLTIPDAAFESKWYKAPIYMRKELLLLMLKSQKPLILHATPIGVMSLSLFITLVKTSYSYYTLLNQST